MIGFPDAERFASNNHGQRRGDLYPRLIIIHYTGMESVKLALERLCSPLHAVSAHYLITVDGKVVQLVGEERRAWHAGKSFWRGEKDINSSSIGIELDNNGFQPFSFPQMQSLVSLCLDIQDRWAIKPSGILGHSDIALQRKTDPGKKFDWASLAQFGVGIWPESPKEQNIIPACEVDFLKKAGYLGYDTSLGLLPVLNAIRLRFSIYRSGSLDGADNDLMNRLLTAFSVD